MGYGRWVMGMGFGVRGLGGGDIAKFFVDKIRKKQDYKLMLKSL